MQRRTRQRDAIWNAVERAQRPLGTEEILGEAQKEVENLGIATVYRTVKALVEEGRLVHVNLPGMPPRYEKSGLHHHHHFYCRKCDRLFELEGCAVKRSADVPEGFEVEEHELTLYGRCAECRR